MQQPHDGFTLQSDTAPPHQNESLLTDRLVSEDQGQPESGEATVGFGIDTKGPEHAQVSDTFDRNWYPGDGTAHQAATDAPVEAEQSWNTYGADADEAEVEDADDWEAGFAAAQEDTDQDLDYILDGEDETIYTEYGQARVISATDGSKDCAAILLDKQLTRAMLEVVQTRREASKTDYLVERARKAIAERDKRLLAVELGLDTSLERLQKKAKRDNVRDPEDQHRKIEGVRKKLEAVKARREQLELDDRYQLDRLEGATRGHRFWQSQLERLLEDIFMRCRLLGPPEDVIDHETEDRETEDPEPLDSPAPPPDPSIGPKDPQELNWANNNPSAPDSKQVVKLRLQREVCNRRDEFKEVEIAFADREASFNRFYEAYLAAKEERGEEVPSQAELDRIQLNFNRGLTRDLMRAEAAYEEAKRRAQEAGVQYDHFHESNFEDDPNDGYAESWENDRMFYLDRGRVEEWLGNVPTVEDKSMSEVAVEEWDARPNSPLDSVSVVAKDSRRKKIDGWRAKTRKGER